MLDLRTEPVIVSYPAFDSKFVNLEISAYDHYVEIPLSTTKGDFKKPRCSSIPSAHRATKAPRSRGSTRSSR
jgi:hypothetical protein